MSAYKDYMDRIEMDKEQQEKLLAALKAAPQTESGADDILNEDGSLKQKPKKKVVMKLVRIAALPAAAMLLIAFLPGLLSTNKSLATRGEEVKRPESVTSAGTTAGKNEAEACNAEVPAEQAPESFPIAQINPPDGIPRWQTKAEMAAAENSSAKNTKSPTGAVPGDQEYGKIVLVGDAEKAFREILDNSVETAVGQTSETTDGSDPDPVRAPEYTFVYKGETYLFLHFEEGFVIRLEPEEGPVISLSWEDTQKLYQLLQEAM